MSKKIYIKEDKLRLLAECDVECDKYEIGAEGGHNPVAGGVYSHAKEIDENFESEVESSEVDLSSFKKKNSLPPNLWVAPMIIGDFFEPSMYKLSHEARFTLIDIANDFWKFVNINWVEPKRIILTGSICNYNWSEKSDIDLHLVVDFKEIDEKTEFVKDYLDAKKNEWNNQHEHLKIFDFPVELYVQDIDEMPESGGIYDVEDDSWIKAPKKNDIKTIGPEKYSIKDKAAKLMTIIDDMIDAVHSAKDKNHIKGISDDAEHLWKRIKDMRKSSLEKHGESGMGNITYKALRRSGYLDKLFSLRSFIYDRLNSINESVLNEYLDNMHNGPLAKYFQWAQKASNIEKLENELYHDIHIFWKLAEQGAFSDYEEDQNIDLAEIAEDDDEYFNYEKYIDDILKWLKSNDNGEQIASSLLSSIDNIVNYENLYCERPSYNSEDFVRIAKNEWAIHFTPNGAANIAKEGFTGGTEDYDNLGYTNAGVLKKYPGYNFAFPLDERDIDNNDYGDEGVMFRTNGVVIDHYGDQQMQLIFWGPYAHDFIPFYYNHNTMEWEILNYKNDRLIASFESVSELADWVVKNYAQYRRAIVWDLGLQKNRISQREKRKKAYYKKNNPEYYQRMYGDMSTNESTKVLKQILNEEVVADGNAEHNPFAKRWKAERDALKSFICNYGTIMTSKENGKQYKCYYDKTLSELIGYNYCICLQWDPVTLKPSSTLYVRALDKFTRRIFQAQFDDRGRDNQRGTADDIRR